MFEPGEGVDYFLSNKVKAHCFWEIGDWRATEITLLLWLVACPKLKIGRGTSNPHAFPQRAPSNRQWPSPTRAGHKRPCSKLSVEQNTKKLLYCNHNFGDLRVPASKGKTDKQPKPSSATDRPSLVPKLSRPPKYKCYLL